MRADWEVDWARVKGKKERAEMWAVGEKERWASGLGCWAAWAEVVGRTGFGLSSFFSIPFLKQTLKF